MSTSGGTIGKVAFDGRSDVGIAGKRRREVGEDVGEKPERIGAAARKKKKKNKVEARRAGSADNVVILENTKAVAVSSQMYRLHRRLRSHSRRCRYHRR